MTLASPSKNPDTSGRGSGPSGSRPSGLATFRAKLLFLILLIVVPAVAITIHGHLEQRRIETARLREKASSIAELAAASQANFIKDTRQLLATLTQFPFLLLSTNQIFSQWHLGNLRKLSPDYADFGLVEMDGTLFCSADLTNRPIKLGDLSFFQRTLQTKRFSVGDFQVDRLTQERTLNLALPIVDEHGATKRVLYASLKLSKLSEGIAHLKVPAGGAVTVFDRSGNVLARFPDDGTWVGKSLSENPAVRKILAGPGGGFEMQGADHVSRWYASTPVTDGQSPGLFASVEVPLTILFAQADEALARNLLILAIIAFAIWLVVWWYAKHSFLEPVAALAATARRLAGGDLAARTGAIRGSTELVQLGKALNEMAAGVQQRTAELLKANEALRTEIIERQKAEEQVRAQEEAKKKLEEQFLRSQRMESIGALAGGIAHDLNNALVPIIMGSQMLKEGSARVAKGDLLDLITNSAQRCAEMVRQILSFARGTRGKRGAVPSRQLVNEMAKIARDTFPKAITVESRVPDGLWDVEGDTTELHQMLMNLCVNARDAMPNGGQLTLTAENVPAVSQFDPARPVVMAKPHVMLSVTDTGTGIPPGLRNQIFEPFFTTKEPDKGTGLGLSTVASLVKRYNGHLELESYVGKGSEFRIRLPAIASTPADRGKEKETPLPSGHGETILLADDEQLVLELAKTTLENYGYRVLTAADGLEAIARFETHKHEVRLLVTDTDMPFLDGTSAIHTIRKISPALPVIVASATRPDPGQFPFADLKHITSLTKPYDVKQLLERVAKMLMTPDSATSSLGDSAAED